jgi:iron complex outermembrane receptor protein
MASSTLIVGAPVLATAQTTQTAPPTPALQEIVVTAERQESVVQRTPAAIAVVGAASLERQHVTQLTDLNSLLLDTQVVPVLTNIQTSIRGIGSNFVDPRADPAVATSVNGLFYDRALPIGFGFLDVARVEDLEGPQGTLYGRNAAAGALNIVTNQPSEQFGGFLNVGGGNLGANEVTAVVNLPLGDTFAIRLAYDRDRRDGYLGDYYDDLHSDTGRISARWTPTNRLTIYLESNYIQLGGHGGEVSSWPCGDSSPWSLFVPAGCELLGAGGQIPATGTTHSYVDSDQIHVDYDFGPVVLTSISGYVGTHDRDELPNGTLFDQTARTDSNDYSEELRLSGHGSASHQGGFAWQVGTYLFDSTGDYFANVAPYPAGSPLYLGSPIYIRALTKTQTYSEIPQSSESGYAQGTYGLTDRLRVTGGVRFSHDFKGLDYQQYSYASVLAPSESTVAAGRASASGDNWSYKGGLEYDLAPGKLLYADVSTGYVAGGVNGGDSGAPLPANVTPAVFKPETITAYEVGSKNRFLDNRLQIDGDFYYYDFRNYQYLYASWVQGGGPVSDLQVQNAASVRDYGVELNGEFALTPDDRLSASVAWSHARFGALSFAAVSGITPVTISAAPGSPVPNDPDWSGLLGYEHTFRLPRGDFFTLSANTKLSSKYLLVVGSVAPPDTQRGYTMTDVSLAYHWVGDKYELRLWAKNLEDAPVNIYGEAQGFYLYGIEPPRTYGATATVRF